MPSSNAPQSTLLTHPCERLQERDKFNQKRKKCIKGVMNAMLNKATEGLQIKELKLNEEIKVTGN